MGIDLHLSHSSTKVKLDSKNFFKNFDLSDSVTSILDNATYINGNLEFTKSKFKIYPLGEEEKNGLEISFIKDFSETEFSVIESSVFGQLGKLEKITTNTYIIVQEESFLGSELHGNINSDKYQGFKIDYTLPIISNFTIKTFYGINNNDKIHQANNSEIFFSYGITYNKKFDKFGTVILDYFKYPELDNYF